jgi:FkbM family methyltransferase
MMKLFVRQVLNLFNSILIRTDKRTFALLFNIKTLLTLKSSRISWSKNYFVVIDKELPGFKYKIRHQKQCNDAYSGGIFQRAINLGKAYLLHNIEFREGDIVIDCGANVGDLKLWFDFNHHKITYIGFEPSPEEFQALEQNVFPSEVHNIGLWNKKEHMEFYISSQGADSSFISPSKFSEVKRIDAMPLEDFVNQNIKLLKIDAEGAEPEVIEGLGKKIKNIEYISADLDFERGSNQLSTLAPVTNYLLQNGFEIVDFSFDRICVLYRNKYFKN